MEAAMTDEATRQSKKLFDAVEYERKNFSERSITKLSEKLKGEEDSHTKNLAYLLVNRLFDGVNDKESFLEVGANGHGRVYSSCVDRSMSENMPPELKRLVSYSCAVWKSNIIIVGGSIHRVGGGLFDASNRVFIYDTLSKDWTMHHMNAGRFHFPAVVAVDDKIFVFCGAPGEPDEGDPSYWRCFPNDQLHFPNDQLRFPNYQRCEYFDFKTQLWKYFPVPPPPFILQCPSISVYAVCPKQDMVLFLAHNFLIVSFNYKNWEWETYGQHMMPIIPAPRPHAQAVVIEDFLFWNDCTTIYAHDLHGRITLPVCTLPTLPVCPIPHSELPGRFLICSYDGSFLVHIGKGMLCLLGVAEDHRIWFIKFLVRTSWGVESATIRIVADQIGLLRTPVNEIQLALLNSSE